MLKYRLNPKIMLEDIVNAAVAMIEYIPEDGGGNTVKVTMFDRAYKDGDPSFGAGSEAWNYVKKLDGSRIDGNQEIDPDDKAYEALDESPYIMILQWLTNMLEPFGHVEYRHDKEEKPHGQRFNVRKPKAGYDVKNVYWFDIPGDLPGVNQLDAFNTLVAASDKPNWLDVVTDSEMDMWYAVVKAEEVNPYDQDAYSEIKAQKETDRERDFDIDVKADRDFSFRNPLGGFNVDQAKESWNTIVNKMTAAVSRLEQNQGKRVSPYWVELAVIRALHEMDPATVQSNFDPEMAGETEWRAIIGSTRDKTDGLIDRLTPDDLKLEEIEKEMLAILENSHKYTDGSGEKSACRIIKDFGDKGCTMDECSSLMPEAQRSGIDGCIQNLEKNGVVMRKGDKFYFNNDSGMTDELDEMRDGKWPANQGGVGLSN